jgi:hypothetical protein
MKKIKCTVIACILISVSAISQSVITRSDTALRNLSSGTISKAVISSQPDLVTTINTIEKSGNFYTIKFTTKNQGGGSVDISKVAMQGNIYTNTGTFITAACFRNLGSSGTLTSGQEVQGFINCTVSAVLYDNENYIYRVTTDNQSAIAESNENNNVAESTFTGHIATGKIQQLKQGFNTGIARSKLPDLIIQINSITAQPSRPLEFDVSYTIKNIGTANVDLKEYSVQGQVRDASNFNYSPAGGHMLKYEGIVLEPGKEFTGTRGISSNLVAGKGYKYKIELKLSALTTNNPEISTSNNTDEKFFSPGN